MEAVSVASLLEATTAFCSSAHNFVVDHRDRNVVSEEISDDTGSQLKDVLGKRKKSGRNGEPERKKVKKAKSDCKLLRVSPRCRIIVGRLLLCNKIYHSWNGIAAAADCLSLVDSTGSICCAISGGFSPLLVGKVVRVFSWSFIPVKISGGSISVTSRHSLAQSSSKLRGSKGSNSEDTLDCNGINLESRGINLQARATNNSYTRLFEDERSNSHGHMDSTERFGFLEIHRLEMMGKQDSEVTTFPSLCVDPVSADYRNALFESPLFKKEGKRSNRLTICGTLQSISPQFALPCNSSEGREDPKSICKTIAPPEDDSKIKKHLSMTGFLIELQYCPFCSCTYIDRWTVAHKAESRGARQLFKQGNSNEKCIAKHGRKQEPKDDKLNRRRYSHVYFSGPVAAWRAILAGSFKQCLTITGLRRKVVLTGDGQHHQFLYVATRQSLLSSAYHSNLTFSRLNCSMEKNEIEQSEEDLAASSSAHDREKSSGLPSSSRYPKIICYGGFVTAILFQGNLIELDKRVWLILTRQGQTKLHGLRVGALLSLRDVHAITIHNSAEKALLLGACVRSYVAVLLFSPLNTPAVNQLHSPSLLLKYLQKLPFAPSFWVFSVIGSFRQKFRGIYSDKELMGSKKDPGIILNYVQSLLAPDNTVERVRSLAPRSLEGIIYHLVDLILHQDAFQEFFDDRHVLCEGEKFKSISKVPPISNLLEHILFHLRRGRSKLWKSGTNGSAYLHKLFERSFCSPLEVPVASSQHLNLIVSSEEFGFTLLGTLQVSPKSGKLQMADATGAIDVIVPDLLSSIHLSKIYQVSRFSLLAKDFRGDCDNGGEDSLDGDWKSPVSWSSLLKEFKAIATLPEGLVIFLHFFMRDATRLDCLRPWNRQKPGQQITVASSGRNNTEGTWDVMQHDAQFLSGWLQERIWTSETGGNVRKELKFLCDIVANPTVNHFFRVSCKVVAVNLLVFECHGPMLRKSMEFLESPSWPDLGISRTSGMVPLGIPLTLASFVVDDGFGLANCWAVGDGAVSLLGLAMSSGESELPQKLRERLRDKFQNYDEQLSVKEILCCLVRRHGKIVMRSERACGASIDNSYSLKWCGGGAPDCVEQAFMQAVVAMACHNRSSVVTFRTISSPGKNAPERKRSPVECCRTLAHPSSRRFLAHDDEYPHLFAQAVEPETFSSDLETLGDDISDILNSAP